MREDREEASNLGRGRWGRVVDLVRKLLHERTRKVLPSEADRWVGEVLR